MIRSREELHDSIPAFPRIMRSTNSGAVFIVTQLGSGDSFWGFVIRGTSGAGHTALSGYGEFEEFRHLEPYDSPVTLQNVT